jgi:VWFA-related protein
MKKAFAFLTLLAASALGQLRESVTVQVVEVPVYVTADGAPVTSLTRENFRLFVNGKPQSIDYFDQIDFAALSPDQARDPRQRRMYMLVFDLNSTPNDLHRAQRAAIDLLDGASVDHTFAVASLGRGAIGVIVPFTRDRLVVRHAIRNLKVSMTGDPLRLGLTPGERGGEIGRPERIEDPLLTVGPGEPGIDVVAMISDEIYGLSELASRLAGMEGHKHVVLLSRGFDASVMHGITGPLRQGDIRTGPVTALTRLNSSLASALTSAPNATLMTQLRQMTEEFTKACVFLHAIDTAGLRSMQTAYDNESLYALARDTGGTVIDRRNNLTSALQVLIDRQRVVYVLGFRPPAGGAETNSIKVKLTGAPNGARATFRPSYSATTAPPDTADRLRLADIVMNDIPQNGVTAEVRVEGSTVELQIPGREVLAHQVAGIVGAEAMFYVVAGPAVVEFRTKKINIDVARAEAGLNESPLRLRETFDLPPGKYAAKVLVRIDGSGVLGFARTDFAIGE